MLPYRSLHQTDRWSALRGLPVLILALTLALTLLVACVQGDATPTPPKIHFGEDVCADCGMIITEPRFAAAYAYEIEPGRYESLAFDDMGDLVNNLKKNQDRTVAGVWAHDYESEEWIDGEAAHYVVSTAIRSPMGHGIAAFAAEEAAGALAAHLGVEVLDWDHMRIEVLMHDHGH